MTKGKTIILIGLFLPLLIFAEGGGGVGLAAAQTETEVAGKIDPQLQAVIQSSQANDLITVIVRLKTQVNLRTLVGPDGRNRAMRLRNVVEGLQVTANVSQRGVRAWLETKRAEGRVTEIIPFWIFNGLAVTATPDIIQELAARPEVLQLTPNEIIQAPLLPPVSPGQVGSLAAEPNLALINVPTLWELGYRGQGIVVANVDTGVDVNHPGLESKWRGGSNSWFDPYGENVTPVDLANPPGSIDNSGHGTRTMGIMVGGEDNGTPFGLAPEARWIAVKVFNNAGGGTTVAFHQAYQWLLDPDGNPATPDAPHIVNSSWTLTNTGCILEFQADLQALRAAGILPIFAAGNHGPTASSSRSPANNPEAFAVGAIDNNNIIKSDSSRGPSACDSSTYPDVVAPGVSIHTTDLSGFYTNLSGTSAAAPHVAGALALLLDASPALTALEQEAVLRNTVLDLGANGPDNIYGDGRVDLLAALQSISADLTVSQTAAPNPVLVNSPLTYTVTITNSGPLTATEVTLTDELPAGATVGSAIAGQGDCTLAVPLTCALGDLSLEATVTITIVLTPTTVGTITNTVEAAATEPDTTPEGNSAAQATAVTGQVFLPLIVK